MALVFGFAASWVTIAVIYLVFAPRKTAWPRLIPGATVAAGSISVLSLGYVVFLNLGTDFERRYATSGLAAIVLLAVWLFLTNALILVGHEVAQDTGRPGRRERRDASCRAQ